MCIPHALRTAVSATPALGLFLRAVVLPLVLAGGLWFGDDRGARAEGALAVGHCGAVGAVVNQPTKDGARDRALAECDGKRGRKCSVVTALSGNCAAFATDKQRSCGPWGWARRATMEGATEAALDECRKGGARSCQLRAQACDQKPPPAMSTNWVSSPLPQAECVTHAETLMKEAGLTTNLEAIGPSVFGERDDYTAQIRCIADKTIVLFVVVGPDLETARTHMRAIFDKF